MEPVELKIRAECFKGGLKMEKRCEKTKTAGRERKTHFTGGEVLSL